MAGKRKRKRTGHADEGEKRQKVAGGFNGNDPIVKHALLHQYYPEVTSLREYLLARLPLASKIRRRKILSLGRKPEDKETDQNISRFLDRTLVGVYQNGDFSQDERWRQWTTFSQKPDESTSFANLSTAGVYSQSEIIDFSIWLMFSKTQKFNGRVQHLLCQGFQKDATARHMNREEHATSAIPGIVSTYPNVHVTSMKAWPWPQFLALFGRQGEKMMIDLILDCGIFVPVENAHGSYYQLSGQPLSEIQMIGQRPHARSMAKKNADDKHEARAPSSINFVRSRMMYARASTNVQGEVHFGFKHNHLLNRWPLKAKLLRNRDEEAQGAAHERSTVQVLMYMFPRQFGLHNVFVNEIDLWQAMQPFKDYTLRDEEIITRFPGIPMPKIPRRLRGAAVCLARKLQINHHRCSYKMLLDHYCPIPGQTSRHVSSETSQCTNGSTKLGTQTSLTSNGSKLHTQAIIPARKPSMMDYATPTAMVSAFCRAVLRNLVPLDFWGTGLVAKENRRIIDQHINTFVELQRFASFSVHHVSQGLKR
ncbi:uncharacterized protein LY89DRAFT_313971 [Mollisia scopiformis]|uniref:Telomerase reverse transcriptase n=1 Tax=Mollisia scopiformis TaxID=149040 RepID=A0A194XRJ8_MOLSC|nr:uncharacterized protein LY89DRAFT_313971 [Mollisia scopiformis]KUJ22915.1 hypothetical protein LY89DRAFT_313971 [Mollisia scopiformis]